MMGRSSMGKQIATAAKTNGVKKMKDGGGLPIAVAKKVPAFSRIADTVEAYVATLNPRLAAKKLAMTPTTPAAVKRQYTPPPAGYRPGIDPEWNYSQAAPAALKRGGKVRGDGCCMNGKTKGKMC